MNSGCLGKSGGTYSVVLRELVDERAELVEPRTHFSACLGSGRRQRWRQLGKKWILGYYRPTVSSIIKRVSLNSVWFNWQLRLWCCFFTCWCWFSGACFSDWAWVTVTVTTAPTPACPAESRLRARNCPQQIIRYRVLPARPALRSALCSVRGVSSDLHQVFPISLSSSDRSFLSLQWFWSLMLISFTLRHLEEKAQSLVTSRRRSWRKERTTRCVWGFAYRGTAGCSPAFEPAWPAHVVLSQQVKTWV